MSQDDIGYRMVRFTANGTIQPYILCGILLNPTGAQCTEAFVWS